MRSTSAAAWADATLSAAAISRSGNIERLSRIITWAPGTSGHPAFSAA